MNGNLNLITLIGNLLCSYQRGSIPFHRLVSEIKVAFDSLQDMDNEWKKEFDEIWFGLEEVNALALDEGEIEPLSGDKTFANYNVTKLLNLTRKAKDAIDKEMAFYEEV